MILCSKLLLMEVGRIYALTDPARPDEVRYVGKTTHTLKRRLQDHYRKATELTDTSHRCNWLRAVRCQGRRAVITLLEEVSLAEIDDAERRWIAYYRQNGADLINATDGGDGGKKMAPHVLERMREAARVQWSNPKTRRDHGLALSANPVFQASFRGDDNVRRITETNTRVWADPERRRRASEAHKQRLSDPAVYEAWQAAKRAANAARPRVTQCRRGHVFEEVGYYVNRTGAKICKACHKQRSAENYHAHRDGTPIPRRQVTHCVNGHEFTPENTSVHISGRRVCKACRLASTRAAAAKRKAATDQ